VNNGLQAWKHALNRAQPQPQPQNPQDREPRDNFRSNRRGPPPVVNKRFADLADEEREKLKVREDRRAKRFAERERGPPPTQNSRFSRAIEVDGDYVRPEHRQALRQNTRGEGLGGGDDFGRIREDTMERSPPPMVHKSRFAAAAKETDDSPNATNATNAFTDKVRTPPGFSSHGSTKVVAPPPGFTGLNQARARLPTGRTPGRRIDSTFSDHVSLNTNARGPFDFGMPAQNPVLRFGYGARYSFQQSNLRDENSKK